MAPEGGPIKLPTWTVYPRFRPKKKRGNLSPAVFFLPWYIICRVLNLIDENGYEIE